MIRLGKGLEMMNSLTQQDEPAPPPVLAPQPPVAAPAPVAYDYGGYDDDDGPVADDV